MTWAERVGDVATRAIVTLLMAIRIVTELVRLVFVTLDSLVMDLGERSEGGLRRLDSSDRAWTKLPGAVLLGIAYVILELLAIVTVLLRQAATKLNDFVVGLAEGEERITAGALAAVASPSLPAGTAGSGTVGSAPRITEGQVPPSLPEAGPGPAPAPAGG